MPSGNGSVSRTHEVLFEAWVKFEAVSEYQIAGYRVAADDRGKATHRFTLRQREDFELSTRQFIEREYRGKKQLYRVIGIKDVDHHYVSVIAALWRNDSDYLDPESQDIPDQDVVEPAVSMNLQDLTW